MTRHQPWNRLALVCAMVSAIALFPGVAQAIGPTLTPQPIVSEGFEGATPARLSLNWANLGDRPYTAYWGPISQRAHSGSRGLWCAGLIPNGGSATSWTLYPDYTAGLATFALPELADYYSARLGFWYVMPSVGSDDGSAFSVLWQPTTGAMWESYSDWLTTSTWTSVALTMTVPAPVNESHPLNLSRTSGRMKFQFVDSTDNPGESPTTGEGPTIDDVTVTGYKYGPVRNLSVAIVDGAAVLSWTVPARSTALAAPDEERPVAYRVYRELDGSNVWTELTSTRITGTTFYDLDTVVPAGTYRYVVQAWDAGSGAGYGQVAISGDTATQFLVGPPHTLIYTAVAHGSIVGSSTQVVSSGGSGSAVTASPATGYHFLSWSDGGPTAARTDTNVTENLSVAASFGINTYQLTYAAGSGGTISGTSPQAVDYGGSGTVVTAIPNAGYHFVSWSDGKATAARTDSGIAGNLSVTASFAINTYQLTYTAGSGGTISGTSPQTVAYNGSGTGVTAVPNTGYHFVSWSDGKATAGRTDSGVTGDVIVSAVFAVTVPDTFTLVYTASAGGSIDGSAIQVVSRNGSGITVTATPNTGYHFVSWSDGRLIAGRTDANVSADLLVLATFAINRYQLHYSAVANGTISGTASQTVDYNSSGTAVTAVPAAGYHFASWSDGYPTAARTDANVTASKTPIATFAINTYALHYGAATGGTISGAADQTVNHGASGTAVTAVASAGHHFVSWSDGGLTATRTDAGVTGDLNVTASFAIDPAAPAFRITGLPTTPTTSPVLPSYETSDSPAPTMEAWMDGALFTAQMGTSYGVEGTHTLVVRLTSDGRTTQHSQVFVIDTMAPDTRHDAPTSVSLTAVTLHLSALDGVTGVDHTYYKLDTATSYTLYTGPVKVTKWGDHTLYYYSVDKLGNTEVSQHVHFSMRNPTAVSISSSPASTSRRHAVTISGYLTPGAHNDHILVQYQKPGSSKWYSVTVHVGTVYSGSRGKWSYRYTPSVRGTYHFKASYAGTGSRYKSVSRLLNIVVR